MPREKPEDRLRRLRARKNLLLEQLKSLRENPPRNAEHKRSLINEEINTITEKIMKLEKVK